MLDKLTQIIIEERDSKKNLYRILVKDNGLPEDLHKQVSMSTFEYLLSNPIEIEDFPEFIRIFILSIIYSESSYIQPVLNLINQLSGLLNTPESIDWISGLIIHNQGIFYTLESRHTIVIHSHYYLDQELKSKIDMLKPMEAMQCPPMDWINNHTGGYITVRTSALLGKGECPSVPLALDVLNKLQSIETNVGYFVWRFDSRGRMYPTGFENTLYAEDRIRARIHLMEDQEIKI